MRVAHVGNYDPHSKDGVTSVVVGLSNALVDHGLDVEVWQFHTGAAKVTSESYGHLSLHLLPLVGGRVANTFWLPESSRRFLRERAASVDLVHIHSVFTPHNIWASRSGAPYILSPHNGYSPRVRFGKRRLLKTLWFKLTEQSLLNRSAAFHAVTERERDDLALLRLPQPVFIIPNGVPQKAIRSDRKTEAGKYLLFLGRLDIHVKGLDLLLDAYANAARRCKLPELVIAGPDLNGSLSALEQKVGSLGLTHAVRFTGPVQGDAKEELLANASAFVLTSRWEGFPLAALEAMAAGLPLLVTEETNLSPLLKQYEVGWSSPCSSSGISANLQAMAETPIDTLLAMAERAKTCIAQDYTWQKIALQITAMYRSTLDLSEADTSLS